MKGLGSREGEEGVEDDFFCAAGELGSVLTAGRREGKVTHPSNPLHVLINRQQQAIPLRQLLAKLVSLLSEGSLTVRELVLDRAETVAGGGELELGGLKGLRGGIRS